MQILENKTHFVFATERFVHDRNPKNENTYEIEEGILVVFEKQSNKMLAVGFSKEDFSINDGRDFWSTYQIRKYNLKQSKNKKVPEIVEYISLDKQNVICYCLNQTKAEKTLGQQLEEIDQYDSGYKRGMQEEKEMISEFCHTFGTNHFVTVSYANFTQSFDLFNSRLSTDEYAEFLNEFLDNMRAHRDLEAEMTGHTYPVLMLITDVDTGDSYAFQEDEFGWMKLLSEKDFESDGTEEFDDFIKSIKSLQEPSGNKSLN